jgi:hypothetical protein
VSNQLEPIVLHSRDIIFGLEVLIYFMEYDHFCVQRHALWSRVDSGKFCYLKIGGLFWEILGADDSFKNRFAWRKRFICLRDFLAGNTFDTPLDIVPFFASSADILHADQLHRFFLRLAEGGVKFEDLKP